MHSKMQIYAEILRQIGRMPDDYKEPDMDDMGEMEEPEEEIDENPKAEVRTKGEKKQKDD